MFSDWGKPYRLLYRSQDAAFDVSNGFGVDGSELVDQPVVQRKQGQVKEKTLSHCLFSPGGSHLCVNKRRDHWGQNVQIFSLEW